MPLNDPKHAFVSDHFLPNQRRRWPSVLRRNIFEALYARRTWTQSAEPMRHAPDAILVGDEDFSFPPRQPVWRIEDGRAPCSSVWFESALPRAPDLLRSPT